MNLIETFGAKVGALSETNPQRARALLSAGFRANGVKNKVAGKKATKSDRMLFQLVNHAMVDCLANPQQNVMVSLFTPCEMLHLQGLHPYSCEAFSSYLSGSMAEQPFLRQAEDTGIPNSLCSYHKIFIGAAQRGSCPSPGSSSPPPWPAMPTPSLSATWRSSTGSLTSPWMCPLSPPPRR